MLWPVWALAAFVHPSLLNTNAELTYIAGQVNAGQHPWKFAYDRMPASTNYVPRTGTHLVISRENAQTPGMDGDDLKNDCDAAYASAWRWLVTGATSHATKTIEILNHMTTIQSITGQGAPLRVAD